MFRVDEKEEEIRAFDEISILFAAAETIPLPLVERGSKFHDVKGREKTGLVTQLCHSSWSTKRRNEEHAEHIGAYNARYIPEPKRLTLIVTNSGSLRRSRDRPREVGPRARCLPPCVLQEHP